MVTNDTFLKAYKDFENELRNNSDYITVKDYEDSLTEPEIQDKLRFARNLRNYLSHHSDGDSLIKVNKDMLDFINEQKETVLRMNGIVQDVYVSIAKSKYLYKLSDDIKTCKDLLQALSKKKTDYAYILNKDGKLSGKVTIYALIDVVIANPRLGINHIPVENTDISVLNKQTPLTTLDSGYYFVQDAKGKICGDIEIR